MSSPKHPHKVSIAMTDDEWDAVVRWAGRDEERRSVWCRESIMAFIAQKEADLQSSARAAGYRLVPLEAKEAGEA